MLGPWSSGLFRRLTLAYVAVIALAFVANAVLVHTAARPLLQQQVESDLVSAAASTLRDINVHLAHLSEQVETWSTLEVMEEVLIQDRMLRIENLLLGLHREPRRYYSALSVLKSDMTILSSTDIGRIGQSVDITRLSEDPLSLLRYSDVAFRTSAGKVDLVLAHPILSRLSTDPLGWLVANVEWERVEEIVSRARIGGSPLDTAHRMMLLDESIDVLAGGTHLPSSLQAELQSEAMRGPEPIVFTRNLGVPGTYLCAIVRTSSLERLPGLKLMMIAQWRELEAYAAIRRFSRIAWAAGALGLVLAVVVSFWLATDISRKLATVSTGIKHLANGDLAHRVAESHEIELGGLARSFNQMAERLERESVERERLEGEILEVSELERRRIGQDLHDGIGQVLTGISCQVAGLRKTMHPAENQSSSSLETISRLLEKATQDTRQVARGLFPVGFEETGLGGALDDLASSVVSLHGVSCQVECSPQMAKISNMAATHLFRIAQEAVNNALKHGHAKSITVTLFAGEEEHGLVVTDDGTGFPENSVSSGGMGLRTMQYRARAIGASLEIKGRLTGGTAVSCLRHGPFALS